MTFDYTDGKGSNYRVSVRYREDFDRYLFSDYASAKKLFDDVLREHKDKIGYAVLADCRKRGSCAVLENFNNDEDLRAPYGTLLANYSFMNDVIYINSEIITPHYRGKMTREQAEEFREAFRKSYEERLALYATPEQRELIKGFMEKHKGAKVSEFTSVG